MLKKFLFGVFSVVVASGCGMDKSFSWHVEYDSRVIPSCLISFSDEYWDWRDAQGPSLDMNEDAKSLYVQYIRRVTELDEPFPIALCNEEVLMSSGLARIMNAFGENSAPSSLYYRMVDQWKANLNQEHNLTFSQFESTLFSSLQELEARFQES